MTTTEMLIETSDKGFVPTRTHNLVSSDPKAVTAFVKKAGLTMGHHLVFASNGTEVIEVCKTGYLCQRDLKPLIEAGYTEWLYSWAFAAKNFRLGGVQVKVSRTVDLISNDATKAWGRALGYR